MAPICGSEPRAKQRKIVILGDGACGKTSLLNVFTRGYFPKVYEPTVFENYTHDIFLDGQPVQLSLWDTAGQEEFDKLRALSYADTHCLVLCFGIDNSDSLANVRTRWLAEILDHCEGVPLVLVALKADLRQDQSTNASRLVSYEEGVEVAKEIGALRYLECSAMTNRGVKEVFTEAARIALATKAASDQDQTQSSSCTLM